MLNDPINRCCLNLFFSFSASIIVRIGMDDADQLLACAVIMSLYRGGAVRLLPRCGCWETDNPVPAIALMHAQYMVLYLQAHDCWNAVMNLFNTFCACMCYCAEIYIHRISSCLRMYITTLPLIENTTPTFGTGIS